MTKRSKLKLAMKNYAIKNGITIPKGFSVSGIRFGEPARTLAWRISGDMGRVKTTDWKILYRYMFPLTPRQKFLATVKAELGVREWPPGSNWGKRVRDYLAAVGIKYPAAWCAAFVTYSLLRIKRDIKLPRFPASCASWVEFAKIKKLFKDKKKARGGDLLLIDWPGTMYSPDHICVCLYKLGPFVYYKTVGGNEDSQVKSGIKMLANVKFVIDFDKLYNL